MGKRKYFNKGLLKGAVAKSELIEFNGKAGKAKFLAIEINTGDSNRVKATFFPTASNATKAKDIHEAYKVGDMVELSGNVREREWEKNGKKGIDRSVAGMTVKAMKEGAKTNATFILQGDVQKVKESEDGGILVIRLDTSYEKDGKKIEQEEIFNLVLDEDGMELVDDLDVAIGCNVKCKGLILNKLEFDDYGDVIDNVQMFKIDKIEDVLQPDEIEDDEEVDFI